MPCSDSSSGLNIYLDSNEKLIRFEFAKITCSREITGNSGYSKYCAGRSLPEIIAFRFEDLVGELGIAGDEEKQFILHLEWDALRAGIVQYLGIDHTDVDKERCQITSIEFDETGIAISEVVLPPKELPKILPCSLGDKN